MTDTRVRTVTAGVDGSPESLAAVSWAAGEAVLRCVPLRLVHVRDWPDTPEIPAAHAALIAERTDTLLQDAATRAREANPGLVVAAETVTGRAAAALVAETAESGPTELLVLGSRGLGGLTGFLAGSVGMAVVAAAHRPVVLVRASGGGRPGREHGQAGDVVVGEDIFQECDALLGFAFEEAARRDRTLRVVHCWSLPTAYGYVAAVDPDITDEVGREIAESLTDTLLPWRLKYPAVRVAERAVTGSAGAELVRAAADAGVLVIGRRRTRLPLGPRLGQVAHAVIHHSDAPVAVVPHG
ncbi:universal stress protein [Streptomyces sp. TRM49041]|uniref:universal stress protein n=1 Tax=Streptomyces sp. TRM49041 TaxID=2603216 RepID=UPI0011EBF01E|nr:universal stress protein [Streptomyces sp. TRM49041]